MDIIDKSFKKSPKHYIIQSLLATATIAVIIYFLQGLTHGVIVAALGASTFTVFALPRAITVRPRRLIGGHVIGLICGSIFYFVAFTGPLKELSASLTFIPVLACALAVGLTMFLMAITNSEHPPAAGTALGIVASGWSYQVVIFVLVCAISLAIVRRALGFYLKDLV